MEMNIHNRMVEATLKGKCKLENLKSNFQIEPEWKMKKFQNIAPKVSEHMQGAPALSGARAAPNAGHQNL
jgi:hypothetical protein